MNKSFKKKWFVLNSFVLLTAMVFHLTCPTEVHSNVCVVMDDGSLTLEQPAATVPIQILGTAGTSYEVRETNAAGTLLAAGPTQPLSVNFLPYAGTTVIICLRVLAPCTQTACYSVPVAPTAGPATTRTSACGSTDPAVYALCDGALYAQYKIGTKTATYGIENQYSNNDSLASYSQTFDDVQVTH